MIAQRAADAYRSSRKKNEPLITDKRQVLKIWENYITELYDRTNGRENVEVEPEEEADAGEQGPHFLQSEVETRQCRCNVTFTCIRATIAVVEKP